MDQDIHQRERTKDHGPKDHPNAKNNKRTKDETPGQFRVVLSAYQGHASSRIDKDNRKNILQIVSKGFVIRFPAKAISVCSDHIKKMVDRSL